MPYQSYRLGGGLNTAQTIEITPTGTFSVGAISYTVHYLSFLAATSDPDA